MGPPAAHQQISARCISTVRFYLISLLVKITSFLFITSMWTLNITKKKNLRTGSQSPYSFNFISVNSSVKSDEVDALTSPFSKKKKNPCTCQRSVKIDQRIYQMNVTDALLSDCESTLICSSGWGLNGEWDLNE